MTDAIKRGSEAKRSEETLRITRPLPGTTVAMSLRVQTALVLRNDMPATGVSDGTVASRCVMSALRNRDV